MTDHQPTSLGGVPLKATSADVDPGAMRSVHEHSARLIAAMRVLDPVRVGFSDAAGCILAQDVLALVPLPGFDNSAMDGYAVRFADIEGASAAAPIVLPVDGDVAAGDTRRQELAPGRALRIMTGAPLPQGCDTIVPVEQSDGGTERVAMTDSSSPGRHIRRQGEDVAAGDVVLRAGTRLGARDLALAAAVGQPDLLVRPRPKVVVVSTGDELVPAGTVPAFGQVVDSNSLMLVTALREHGMAARLVSGVVDDERVLLDTLTSAAADADAVVTTGGVSMGAFDVVKSALATLGTVEFTKVAMQPGKPQGFGTLGPDATPVFTLPGNPVSALVSLEVFVMPALRVMAGRDAHEARLVEAVVEDGWTSPAGKMQFTRAVVTRTDTHHTVRSAGGQGSHLLGALAEANALAIVPAETTRVVPGQDLLCLPLGPVHVADHGRHVGAAPTPAHEGSAGSLAADEGRP